MPSARSAEARARVVVIGGFGNFGARICRALGTDPDIEVLAAARDPTAGAHRARFEVPVEGVALDINASEFPAALARLAPVVVVHCAGPFQGQDYAVARAAIAAGAHYVDLADGRDFVAGFQPAIDGAARDAGVLALSGASSVPALSSAVVDAHLARFRELQSIRTVIAPGQRAARGAATLAGVFGYAGRPVRWLNDGRWQVAHGWQNLARVRLSGLSTRWSALCDVPDLALFPARYPGVCTVEFRAALELGVVHHALWLAAAWRRIGLPLPIERWAAPLDRLAGAFDRFGTDRGGMRVSMHGLGHDGARLTCEWSIVAGENHGPEIPCMAAILAVRRLARGAIDTRGAQPCMGFVRLEEFAPEFARWGMVHTSTERAE